MLKGLYNWLKEKANILSDSRDTLLNSLHIICNEYGLRLSTSDEYKLLGLQLNPVKGNTIYISRGNVGVHTVRFVLSELATYISHNLKSFVNVMDCIEDNGLDDVPRSNISHIYREWVYDICMITINLVESNQGFLMLDKLTAKDICNDVIKRYWYEIYSTVYFNESGNTIPKTYEEIPTWIRNKLPKTMKDHKLNKKILKTIMGWT